MLGAFRYRGIASLQRDDTSLFDGAAARLRSVTLPSLSVLIIVSMVILLVQNLHTGFA